MPRDTIAYAEPLAPVDEDAKVLLRAAEIIEQRGWVQFSYGHWERGPVCATKAVWIAMMEMVRWNFDFQTRLGFSGVGGDYLSIWNDKPRRTVTEVTDLLRHGAAAGRP